MKDADSARLLMEVRLLHKSVKHLAYVVASFVSMATISIITVLKGMN